MVDVSPKTITLREARAYGEIQIKPEVIKKIKHGATAKGNVLAVAKIAGIMAAKRVDELIPLCHSLNLDSVDLRFDVKANRIAIESLVKTHGKTGAEMEALTAVSLACLTIYDMVKSLDKEMTIGPIYLLEKKGGRSGHYMVPGLDFALFS